MYRAVIYVVFVLTCLVAEFQSGNAQCTTNSRPLYLFDNGSISSPNFPNNYPHNSNCQWILVATCPSCVMMITFENFTTEECCDSVQIRDGPTSNSIRIATLSGSNIDQRGRRFSTTQQYMFVQFISDNTVNATGFTATFQSIDYPYCGSSTLPINFIGNGIIHSPYYPYDYPNMVDCHWRLTATNGHVIKLTFKSFATESAQDVVRIYDGSTSGYKLLATLSGSSINTDTYWSKQQYMYVQFVSNSATAYEGFNATFESIAATTTVAPSTTTGIVDARCPPAWQPQNLQTSGTLQSINYPSNYSNNIDCHWRINAGYGLVPRIRLIYFATEKYYDFLRIYDGRNTSSNLITSMSGLIYTIPTSYYAQQQYMYIQFTTDESITTTGFSLTFESIDLSQCPPSTQPRELYYSGSFSSLNYPNDYIDGLSCHWRLQASYMQVVKITFNYFETETVDYVMLFDGRSDTSSIIASLSGDRNTPVSYYSTGEYMYVRFVTDSSVTDDGFSATFMSTDYPVEPPLESWEIALIVIGCVVAVAVAMILIGCICRFCKQKKCAAKTSAAGNSPAVEQNPYAPPTSGISNVAYIDSGLCVFCMEHPSDKVGLVPCGHAKFCGLCIHKMLTSGGNCPVCHQRVQAVLPLYT